MPSGFDDREFDNAPDDDGPSELWFKLFALRTVGRGVPEKLQREAKLRMAAGHFEYAGEPLDPIDEAREEVVDLVCYMALVPRRTWRHWLVVRLAGWQWRLLGGGR